MCVKSNFMSLTNGRKSNQNSMSLRISVKEIKIHGSRICAKFSKISGFRNCAGKLCEFWVSGNVRERNNMFLWECA